MDFHPILAHAHHLMRAQGSGLLHSPFVFDFKQLVLNPSRKHYAFQQLDRIRFALSQDRTMLPVEDHGAGSKSSNHSEREVRHILKHSVKRRKHAEMLFRLANRFQPRNILELGTSLGLTTLYFSEACPRAHITTIEGAPDVAAFAQRLFQQQGRSNISCEVGTFDARLPEVAARVQWDLVYVDGNHRERATVEMVECLLPHCAADAIFVLDDIHWSAGMHRAWKHVSALKEFQLSLDLLEMGVLFSGLPMPKQQFRLRH